MKLAMYIRVSTDEQAKEGFSLIAQEAILRRHAEQIGAELVDPPYIDDGYSAKDMKRPALRRMVAEFSTGKFDAFIFWRLDRFTRSSKDFHKMAELMKQHNIGMISVSERIDMTTAFTRFQLELLVSLAQLERETTSTRVKEVNEERARKGLRNAAPAALGYEIVDGKLVVNEAQKAAVLECVRLYLEGNGVKPIAHMMIRNTTFSPMLKWSGATIKYLLQNELYIGKIRRNYAPAQKDENVEVIITDGDHEPIIDLETFERVQKEFKLRERGGKRRTSDHIFSSVLRCGKCGGRMQGFAYKRPEQEYIYKTYRCGNKIEHGTCDMPNMREAGVEEAFLSSINTMFLSLNVDAPSDNQESKVKELRSQLERISQRKKRWQLAFANELITLEELREHTNADKENENRIMAELQLFNEDSNEKWSKEELESQLKKLKHNWHLIEDIKAKKLFVQELFEYLILDVAPGEIAGQGRRPKLIIRDYRFQRNSSDWF